MKVKVFAKERPYLIDFINHVKAKTKDVDVYIGKIGDPLPEEAFKSECDILFSYSSPWIIPKSILDKTKKYNINFHPGPPEYPGIGCVNFALYNGETRFGATAHLMDEKVDTGRIIKVIYFPIYPEDTVKTLLERTYFNMFHLATELVNEVFESSEISFSQETWTRKPYTRKELEDLYCIKLDLNNKIDIYEMKRIIRSTYYHPYTPYILIHGYKFVLVKEDLG